MPKLVANVTIGVQRKGERVDVKPGQPFDFTEDEVNEINAINPEYLRTPVNETAEATKSEKTGKAAAAEKTDGAL